MTRFICGFAFLATLLVAQVPVIQLNDGERHGDPPFLLEDGWRPLINGQDLSGWIGVPGRDNKWHTARGVRYEPRLRPITLFAVSQPGPTLFNPLSRANANLMTEEKFGDIELYLEFLIPKGGDSGVYLHGLYELQIHDSYEGLEKLSTQDAGSIYHEWIDQKASGGSVASRNMARPPGVWQSYQIWFRAPRFDAQGKKVENARIQRVLYNGLSIQNDVELRGPTRAALNIPEAPQNPIMLQGDHEPIAFRNIHVRPLRPIVRR